MERGGLVAIPGCTPKASDLAYWLFANLAAGEETAIFAAWLREEGAATDCD